MLGTATAILEVSAGRILQLTPSGGRLEILVRHGSPGDRIAASQQSVQQMLGWFHAGVLSERSGVEVPDVSMDPRWRNSADHAPGFTSYLGFPIAWPDGAAFGVIEVLDPAPRTFSDAQRKLLEQFRDNTEDNLARIMADAQRWQMDASLYAERERLILATAASGSGVWDYNIDADILHCDARWHEIVGLDPANPVKSIEDFKPHIHPDDVARATEVRATLAQLIANKRGYRITFRIVRPDGEIRWLNSAACVIAAGYGSPNRAVGAVMDVTEQIQATQALAESELRFKTLADMLPQNIFSTLSDGTIDYRNKRWREFAGLAVEPADAALWPDLLHPDDRTRAVRAWQDSLATGQRLEVEARYRHHSGEYRWLHMVALPLVDDEGQVTRWFGAATDVHDAKLLQINRELVARELDHRIRNLFALVDGLVGLSVRNDPGGTVFAGKLRQRLAALHRAHSLIGVYGPTAPADSLRDLIRTLLEPYENDADERILISGDDTRIDERAIVPLALIFHELATNASKYGGLRAAQGGVHVSCERQDEWLRITWAEIGACDSTGSPERKGFGTKLLSALVEVQLRGTLSRQWTPQGLVIELRLPLSVLDAPAAPPAR